MMISTPARFTPSRALTKGSIRPLEIGVGVEARVASDRDGSTALHARRDAGSAGGDCMFRHALIVYVLACASCLCRLPIISHCNCQLSLPIAVGFLLVTGAFSDSTGCRQRPIGNRQLAIGNLYQLAIDNHSSPISTRGLSAFIFAYCRSNSFVSSEITFGRITCTSTN